MTSIAIDRLRELLAYDPLVGVLTWRTKRSGVSRKQAGSLKPSGYIVVQVDRKMLRAHRIAWALTKGEWPEQEIDHRNGDRSDNRWANLREATHAENAQNKVKQSNNKSGYLGVCWFKPRGKWKVEIQADKKRRHVGYFDDVHEAAAAYAAAKSEIHPFQPSVRF